MRNLISRILIGGLITIGSGCSLPADMGKTTYVPADVFCQCGNYKTALDPRARVRIGGPCHCDPALGGMTGTIVAN
jgi:hypothetical protein